MTIHLFCVHRETATRIEEADRDVEFKFLRVIAVSKLALFSFCVARSLEQPVFRRAVVSLWHLPRPRRRFLLVLSDEVGWSFGINM